MSLFPAFARRVLAPSLLAAFALQAGLSACVSAGEEEAPEPGAARLDELLYNPKWYRTLDSSHSIAIEEGTLLFAWTFRDSLRRPDSFYVGIDTLWAMPREVEGDTSPTGSWDLQVCPDGFCIGGFQGDVHGGNAPGHFGGKGEHANREFATEHHFQFFPAIDPGAGFRFTAPESTIVGAMMFVRSRSGRSRTDTVFAFGAWKLEWDEEYPPPVRPVDGYLPKRSDFAIVDGKVRYTAP